MVTDEGSDVLLLANEPGVARPSTGGPYHWTTPKGWWVGCLPDIKNGEGEGFLAISPAGVKYHFDWMAVRKVGVISELLDLDASGSQEVEGEQIEATTSEKDGASGSDVVASPPARYMNTYLRERWMLPTRVEDRFGNWVQYTYSADLFARLTSITSSDGRSITLHYNALGHVTQVVGGGQTVNYSYQSVFDGKSLKIVTLPDSSTWDYSFANTFYMQVLPSYSPSDPCAQPASPPYGQYGPRPPASSYQCIGWPQMIINGPGARTISVKTPSNALVEYVFDTHFQLVGTGGYSHDYPIGLLQKTISGPGMPTRSWQYQFGPDIPTTRSQCLAGACPTSMWANELAPESAVVKRTFGLQTATNQGLLIRESEGLLAQGAPSFKRDIDYSYRIGTAVGHHPGGTGSYVLFTERRMPVQVRQVAQEGRTFRREVLTWDALDRETTVKSTSD